MKEGAELVHHDGARTTAGGLWDELMADPEFDEWIVQERMHNHPDLVAIGGAASLHSARITTIVDRDGRPELLFGFLKLALSGAVSDNFLGGAYRERPRPGLDGRRAARAAARARPRPPGHRVPACSRTAR